MSERTDLTPPDNFMEDEEIESLVESSQTRLAVVGKKENGYTVIRRTGRTFTDLKNVLAALNVKVRYNTRPARDEIYRFNEQDGKWEWVALDSRTRGTLLQGEIKEKIAWEVVLKSKSTSDHTEYEVKFPATIDRADLKEALFVACEENAIDPVKEWLENLPEWDKAERLDFLIQNCFAFDGESEGLNDLAAYAARSVVLGVIERTFNPGSKKDEVVILQGSEGCAKSTFWEYLVPEGEGFFSDTLNFDEDEGRQIEATSGCAIVEISEGRGLTNPRNSDKIKAFITRRRDKRRRAYGEQVSDIPRCFVIVGSVNPFQCLPNDPQGNRRFVVLHVEGLFGDERECSNRNRKYIVEYLDENREQIWAEGMFLHKEGERSYLPSSLVSTQREINLRACSSNQYVEDAVQDLLDREPFCFPITSKDLYVKLGYEAEKITRPLQHEISQCLGFRGYSRKSVRIGGIVKMAWVLREEK